MAPPVWMKPVVRAAAVDASAGTPRDVANRIVGLIEGRTREKKPARR